MFEVNYVEFVRKTQNTRDVERKTLFMPKAIFIVTEMNDVCAKSFNYEHWSEFHVSPIFQLAQIKHSRPAINEAMQ
jgi:hypothetical protein